MSKKVLILGAGFGGLEAAFSLRKNLPSSYQVTLIDKKDYFIIGFTKFDVMFGHRSSEQIKLYYKNLKDDGISFVQDTITLIDPVNKIVTTTNSEFSFDYLIIALGACLKPNAIPGFTEAGYEFYSLDGAQKLNSIINNFESGKIIISIFSKPYKCPPAPYEAAFQLHDLFLSKGVRNKIEISVAIPGPVPIPVSSFISEEIEKMLSEKSIRLLKNHKIIEVDPQKKQVITKSGTRQDFDLLIGIPVHIPPEVVADSPLGKSWIKVNKDNLETVYNNIYAVGDVISVPIGQFEVPKAGTFAEEGAKVVVTDILNKEKISGTKINYRALGTCYFETGSGKVARINADFLSNTEPQITLDPPSPGFKQDKENFEKERKERWFK